MMPVLLDGLKNDDPFVRGDAAHTLAELGAKAKPAVPAMKKLLADENHGVRVHTAESLFKIDAKLGPELLPVLIDGLKNEDKAVRAEAAEVLGRIGPAAEAAIPELQAMAKDRNKAVRAASAEAVKQIRGK